jgi:hypothetical protein
MPFWLRRCRFIALLVLAAITFGASFLRAQPTNILVSGWLDPTMPTNPIPVGNWVVYSASFDDVPAALSWYYRCTVGGPKNWALAAQSSASAMFLENMVGTQDVEVVESEMIGVNPPVTSLTTSIDVAGPDADSIVAGLNTVSTGDPGMMTLEIDFQMSVGGTVLGQFVMGGIQEHIERPQFNFDGGWTNAATDQLYLQGDCAILGNLA